MPDPTWKKGEKNLKKKGNYDILSFKYPPFQAGAKQREMERGSPQKIAFTWRGINLDSFDQAWELICQYCKSNITEVAYNTWFSRLKPVSLDFDRATAIIEMSGSRWATVDSSVPKALINIVTSGLICRLLSSQSWMMR